MAKYIFITGGVMSGLGKGIATASIGKILQSKGYRVTAVKIDPYVNIDAGTMNPIEHGEVFVTEDGLETDQDIGNYERFLNQNISSLNYMTTGSVYNTVIQKERNLDYKGRCVEVIPDIPNEVIGRIKKAGQAAKAEIVLIEIGGTIGEYQNAIFLEAARMMKLKSPSNVLFVMLSYLPVPAKIGEMKTKPTQYAVRTLNSTGIQPDFILARSSSPLDDVRKGKISIFCNISQANIISAPDVESIYDIPLNFENDKLGKKILKKLKLPIRKTSLHNWAQASKIISKARRTVHIGLIGKYFKTGKFTLADSYISVIEAVRHGCWVNNCRPVFHWIDSQKTEKQGVGDLEKVAGLVITQGWGKRGAKGMIKAIQYCRENKKPCFGLCYGMQMAVIEFARNVCHLKEATSEEINPRSKHQVIHLMPDQKARIANKQYGGTIRLGAYPCCLKKNSKVAKIYKKSKISERHRHRYEFNNEYREVMEKNGLVVSGFSPDNKLVEIIEISKHPFFIATQFHPEYKSRFMSPHPLFVAFIKASLLCSEKT
ncbi:CTP synthase [bacterium]|nr:CTP synthase [bacterium]